MPPQSDQERLKEVKDRIHDRGAVTAADVDTLTAIRENLTGEPRDAEHKFTDMAAADAFIEECLTIANDRDAENLAAAGNTSDDGKGSAEKGTDAVHRAADQSPDDNPDPNAVVSDEEEVEEEDAVTGEKKKVKKKTGGKKKTTR